MCTLGHLIKQSFNIFCYLNIVVNMPNEFVKIFCFVLLTFIWEGGVLSTSTPWINACECAYDWATPSSLPPPDWSNGGNYNLLVMASRCEENRRTQGYWAKESWLNFVYWRLQKMSGLPESQGLFKQKKRLVTKMWTEPRETWTKRDMTINFVYWLPRVDGYMGIWFCFLK